MKPYVVDNIKETTFDTISTLVNIKNSEPGRPTFERIVEYPWVADKLSQVMWRTKNCFDFGCYKAWYLSYAKQKFGVKTVGCDLKPKAKKFVDTFYLERFSDETKRKVMRHAPFDVALGISSIEHAGHDMHPNELKIRDYQLDICDFMIGCSRYFFMTVPFGKRPGWPVDGSRKNLYQFNQQMLDQIQEICNQHGKLYMSEFYTIENDTWKKSSSNECKNSAYRNKKSGASAIALVSIWTNEY